MADVIFFRRSDARPSCAGLEDPEVMFDGVRRRWVLDMCNSCPLRLECLEYALRVPVDGIWGGTTFEERRRMNPRLPAVMETTILSGTVRGPFDRSNDDEEW